MSGFFRASYRAAAIFTIVPFLLVIAVSAGCVSSNVKQTNVSSVKTYRITGSNACLPLLKILTASYVKKHPEIKFNYLPGSTSTAAFTGIKDGTLDIGAISRGPTEPGEESPGAIQKTLSKDALVFVTHKNINVYNLTTDQVRRIYSGAILNWADVGGPNKSIVVLDRAENETVKEIIRQYCLGQITVTPGATILYSEPEMDKALQLTDDSIGYVSLGGYKSQKLPLNVPKLDGIEPGVTAVENNTYKMTRTLGLVIDKNANSDIKGFVEWANGSEAKNLMEKNGYASPD
jgi:phosphate transport system substrate-binding protein